MKIQACLCVFAFTLLACSGATPPEPRFRSQVIDTNVAIGYGVAVGDVDGDGKQDVVLADKTQIVWYRNPGWTRYVMAEKLTELDNVCVAVYDADEDGKVEVAVGAGWNPGDTVNSGANFFLLPPQDRTQLWRPVRLPHEPTVHRMHFIRTPSGQIDLVVAPLHGRGNKNGQGDGVRIVAYRMPSGAGDSWRNEVVDSSLHLTHNFQPVKWEGREWHELLVAAREGVFYFSKTAAGWRRDQLVGNEAGVTNFLGAGEVRDGRLDASRRFLATIEPMHGNQVVLYTPPAKGAAGRFWQRRVLDESLVDGHAVACGDLLGIGSDQIVAGWRAMNRPGVKVGIRLYTPLDAAGTQWRTTLIDDNRMACEDLRIADLNGDGKPDIVASGRSSRNLILYINETEASR